MRLRACTCACVFESVAVLGFKKWMAEVVPKKDIYFFF